MRSPLSSSLVLDILQTSCHTPFTMTRHAEVPASETPRSTAAVVADANACQQTTTSPVTALRGTANASAQARLKPDNSYYRCPLCGGKGYRNDRTCGGCDGQGLKPLTISEQILDAFVTQHPTADYDDLTPVRFVGHDSESYLLEWDDPAARELSHSPRTFGVRMIQSVDPRIPLGKTLTGFSFEEI